MKKAVLPKRRFNIIPKITAFGFTIFELETSVSAASEAELESKPKY